MPARRGEDMSPAEAALLLLEVVLDVLVVGLLVSLAALLVVGVVARAVPWALIAALVFFAVSVLVVRSRWSDLSRRIAYATGPTRGLD